MTYESDYRRIVEAGPTGRQIRRDENWERGYSHMQIHHGHVHRPQWKNGKVVQRQCQDCPAIWAVMCHSQRRLRCKSCNARRQRIRMRDEMAAKRFAARGDKRELDREWEHLVSCYALDYWDGYDLPGWLYEPEAKKLLDSVLEYVDVLMADQQ